MKKSILTQSRILEVAETMFLKAPVEKVSMRAIAEAAGVSKGTIYLYYETKEDLVWSVIDQYLKRFLEILETLDLAIVDLNSVDEVIDLIFEFIETHQSQMRMLHEVSFHGYVGLPRIEKKYGSIWQIPLRKWVESGIEKGIFHVEYPEFTTDFIYASVHTMIDSYILQESAYDEATIRHALKIMIKKMLR
ncbi:MAG: TetR/AcrR family transcriptional regulator [Clostridia bacterium]|nr:TetR/AcrR family transcriptional regulator [Clostridia bacterium]